MNFNSLQTLVDELCSYLPSDEDSALDGPAAMLTIRRLRHELSIDPETIDFDHQHYKKFIESLENLLDIYLFLSELLFVEKPEYTVEEIFQMGLRSATNLLEGANPDKAKKVAEIINRLIEDRERSIKVIEEHGGYDRDFTILHWSLYYVLDKCDLTIQNINVNDFHHAIDRIYCTMSLALKSPDAIEALYHVRNDLVFDKP